MRSPRARGRPLLWTRARPGCVQAADRRVVRSARARGRPGPSHRPVRRDDDRDGRDRRIGDLRHARRRRAERRLPRAHPRRLGRRRRRRAARRVRLRRALLGPPGGGRAIRLPARSGAPAGGVPLRLGASPGHPDRRDGGDRDRLRRYFRELLPIPLGEGAVAAGAVGTLTIVNCLGVRAGSTAQSALMVLKICALGALIGAGLLFGGVAPSSGVPGSPAGFGAALIPVLFAYGGWQTACFVAGEMKDPRRDLPRALLLGVAGVIALYTLV